MSCPFKKPRGKTQERLKRLSAKCVKLKVFLLLILNTSFCSSCTKRKNSLIWALIIVDISIILIRSTLMMFFCNFVMTWLISLLRLFWPFPYKKKKVNVSPQYSVFTQPVQLFVFVSFFCSYGVKIRGNYFKEKGHEKRKEWPRIILCISLCIQLMLFICYIFVNPQQI